MCERMCVCVSACVYAYVQCRSCYLASSSLSCLESLSLSVSQCGVSVWVFPFEFCTACEALFSCQGFVLYKCFITVIVVIRPAWCPAAVSVSAPANAAAAATAGHAGHATTASATTTGNSVVYYVLRIATTGKSSK